MEPYRSIAIVQSLTDRVVLRRIYIRRRFMFIDGLRADALRWWTRSSRERPRRRGRSLLPLDRRAAARCAACP